MKSIILLTRGAYCPSRLSRSAVWAFVSLILFLPSVFAQQSSSPYATYNQALLQAAKSTDTAAVTNALNAGANPNALTPQGQTVLEIAHQAWTELPDDTAEQSIEKRNQDAHHRNAENDAGKVSCHRCRRNIGAKTRRRQVGIAPARHLRHDRGIP